MKLKSWSSVWFILPVIVLIAASSKSGAAQDSGQNPTPIVIDLTPAPEAATATPGSAFGPDRFYAALR